jgi:mRNA-degrading endonuclease RelE of RelBE toxin-antitoxin system
MALPLFVMPPYPRPGKEIGTGPFSPLLVLRYARNRNVRFILLYSSAFLFMEVKARPPTSMRKAGHPFRHTVRSIDSQTGWCGRLICVDIQDILTIIMVTMMPKRSLTLIYAPLVRKHLWAIDSKYYSLIRREIEAQLLFEPDVETRNRKPLKRTIAFEATWEIRFGPGNRFRVFYKVERKKSLVNILAIGEKRGSQLFVGGKEIDP